MPIRGKTEWKLERNEEYFRSPHLSVSSSSYGKGINPIQVDLSYLTGQNPTELERYHHISQWSRANFDFLITTRDKISINLAKLRFFSDIQDPENDYESGMHIAL
jgi:hypothetical protein